MAKMLDLLDGYGAKAVGLSILFSEEDRNPALAELDKLAEHYKLLVSSKQIHARDPIKTWKPLPAETVHP
ncbi:MAG: hypothetical protein IH956_10115, partial [Chloroflexi bacterium]|nr:hypothetical protein [Chloroflexota bacterium]